MNRLSYLCRPRRRALMDGPNPRACRIHSFYSYKDGPVTARTEQHLTLIYYCSTKYNHDHGVGLQTVSFDVSNQQTSTTRARSAFAKMTFPSTKFRTLPSPSPSAANSLGTVDANRLLSSLSKQANLKSERSRLRSR
jgi:hypothetical protein